MTAEPSEAATSGEASDVREPNDLLRRARLRTPSPDDQTRPMSQRELAEAVTAHVVRATGRDVALDRHDISRWERGQRRFPIADYRSALRAVLGVSTDAELGFYFKPRVPGPGRKPNPPRSATASRVTVQPIGAEVTHVQLVVSPGTAVLLLPVDQAVVSALVSTVPTTDL